ncbi:hypothetical protein PRO82_001261 [Candidatus Protochlamydia amoebophila]|nr:hypothetical protein [Candidatus Protochlamydia amoebophila]
MKKFTSPCFAHGLFCFASLIIKANLAISIPENSLSRIFKFLLETL